MNAKILCLFLMIFVVMVFSGCTQKELVYVDRPVQVNIPTKCVIQIPVCDSNKLTYTGEINEMRLCINRLREAMNQCNEGVLNGQ